MALLRVALVACVFAGACAESNAKRIAASACNGWAAVLEESDPQKARAILKRSRDNAAQAAKLDDQWLPLSNAFDMLVAAVESGDTELLIEGTDRAFDRCEDATDADEEVRRELERLQSER